jgi:hypothetical protein
MNSSYRCVALIFPLRHALRDDVSRASNLAVNKCTHVAQQDKPPPQQQRDRVEYT